MIQAGSRIKAADNSGAKILNCFKILGGTRKRYARIGDLVVASIKVAEPRSMVKEGDVVKIVIVRTRERYHRKDGSWISFDENAGVVLGDGKDPKGTRIFGPVPRELKELGYTKVASLALEVL
jgi:large subunit ribosomal protein L14